MPRGVYRHTPEHTERIAATKRGKPRSPETIAKMSTALAGLLVGPRNGRYRPIPDRFWEKVTKSDGCWLWTGSHDENGYGLFQTTSRRSERAHRVAWRLHTGQEIPAGAFVLHHCDMPPCVNPAHLWLGSNADNMRDMWTKGRRQPKTP